MSKQRLWGLRGLGQGQRGRGLVLQCLWRLTQVLRRVCLQLLLLLLLLVQALQLLLL